MRQNLQNAAHIEKCSRTLWRTSLSDMDNITARANVSLAEASPLSQYEDCADMTEEVN